MILQSHILPATIDSIHYSLMRHMPLSQQRQFYLWGISSNNPHQPTFLSAVNVPQLVGLSAFFLDGLVPQEHWAKLCRYAGRINSYFMYEVASDDLAIGLAPFADTDTAYPLRREILYAFNYVMIERLGGEPTRASIMLEPLEFFSKTISTFTQSMTREKHMQCLREYRKIYPDVSGLDIEYAVWPLLVANIEACRELAEDTYQLEVHQTVRQGFIDRYRASTELLEATGPLSLDELAEIGTRSILVIPTLAYFTGVIAEIIDPQPGLPSLFADGTLPEALRLAALLVRLLNDVGLPLTLSAQERHNLVERLYQRHQENPALDTVIKLLIHTGEGSALLTRFHKDAAAGEFNMCLHNLAYVDSLDEELGMLEDNIAYYADMYRRSYTRLGELLTVIDSRLKTNAVGGLIARFVMFYAQLYARPYRTMSGEYVA